MHLIWAYIRRWWHCLWHLITFKFNPLHCGLTFWGEGIIPVYLGCTCGRTFYMKKLVSLSGGPKNILCPKCNMEMDGLAGNPSLWPVHVNDGYWRNPPQLGKGRNYCSACVAKAMERHMKDGKD